MKIAHLADIHLRLYQRIDEYKLVFERLYESLKKEKVEHIVLAGDIFHSKSLLSPESVNEATEFFPSLAEIAPVDIVVGNHDVNLKNKDRIDAISPLLKRINGRNAIRLFTKSGIYFCGPDIRFGVFSLLDEENFPVDFNRENGKTYIALFHGNLLGSVTESGWVMKEGYDSASLFKNYDAGMLGDIHRRQEVMPKFWYPGSLIQQDYGESRDKGYLLWDTDDLSTKFIPVPNDYAFYNVKVEHKITPQSIPVIQNVVPKSLMKVVLKGNYTIATQKLIEAAFREKYNPYYISVQKEWTPDAEELLPGRIQSTADVAYQNSLITDQLSPLYDDEFIKDVCDINRVVMSQIPSEEVLQPIEWKVKHLTWENTFSYGKDNTVALDHLRGLTGIFAPNRYGKSNFLDTILYCLFNKSSRTSKIAKIINNQSKDCYAQVHFEANGVTYRIIRKSRKSGKNTATEVQFEKWENQDWVSANEGTRTETDKAIRRLIGSYDDFIVSSFSPQGKISWFLEAGHDETYRLDLLSRFLGLNIFKLQYDIAHKESAGMTKMLKELKNTDYATEIDELKRENEMITESQADFEEDREYLRNELHAYHEQLGFLRSSKIEEREDSRTEFSRDRFVQAIETTRLQLKEERESFERVGKRSKELKERLDKKDISVLTSDVESYQKLKAERDELTSQLRVEKAEWEKDAFKLNAIKSQQWMEGNELCHKCVFYQDAKEIDSKFQQRVQQVKGLKDRKNELDDSLSKLETAEAEYEAYQQALNEFNLSVTQIKTIKLSIEKLQLQIEKAERALEDFDKEASEIEALRQVKQLNQEVARMIIAKEEEIDSIKRRLNTVDYAIHSNDLVYAENDTKIRALEDGLEKLNKMEKEFERYTAYLKCVHREGIPYTIITSYIGIINREVDRIIGDYVPFKVQFSVDYEKKLIPINIIYENGTECPVEMASGMEKMIIAIAIRAAFASIMNIPHSNLFIVDESFGALDPEWRGSIDKLLEHLKTMFEHILLISHVPDIQDYVDQTITVEKENDFSRLYYI